MTSSSTGPVSWQDALVVADCENEQYVISSPNASFVPRPPVGIVEISLRSDYRYGVEDPIQWPQLYTPEYDYLCAIMRPPPAGDRRFAPVWWTPTESQFFLVEGSMFKCLGLLDPHTIRPLAELVHELSRLVDAYADESPLDERLRWLHTAMRNALDRLKHFPCTFRDAAMQVRETQRYWLMTRAFLDYTQKYRPAELGSPLPVDSHVMGAFTTDPGVVQRLFTAGIPVWYIRTDVSILGDTNVQEVVRLTHPTDVCVDRGPEDGYVLYKGLSGRAHLAVTARGGHTFVDISRAPLLAVHEDGGYPAPTSQKEYIGILSRWTVPSAGQSRATGPSDAASAHAPRHARGRGATRRTSHVHQPC